MISFFRRALSSWLVLGLFALILIAFLITGFGSGSGLETLATSGDQLAKAGHVRLNSGEATSRIEAQFESARRETPTLEFSKFAASGEVDQLIEMMVSGRAIEAFASATGMAVSPRQVDAEIAGISAFNGPTGSFDRNSFLTALAQRKISEDDLRGDIARDLLSRQMIVPVSGAARAPLQLVTPYASLLLETRHGQIGFIPAARFAAGPAPTDAELNAFYRQQVARYTLPETRVLRYALIDRAQLAARATPSEAEIAAAFKADSAKYAPRDTRVLTQVVAPDQAKAKALATRIRAGTPIAEAARAAGLDAITLDPQDKRGYAAMAAPAVADAAFAAPRGGVTEPVKSAFGWHVVRIDSVETIAGKSLEQVRPTIIAALAKTKGDAAFAEYLAKIDDQIGNGATFDDVIKAEGLTMIKTAPITASGIDPANPAKSLAPEYKPMLAEAFQAEPDDDAALVALVAGEKDVLVDVDTIQPAAPRPLAAIRAQVSADFAADRAARAARKAADAIVAASKTAAGFAAALKAAGVAQAQPVSAMRLALAQAGDKAPRPLTTLFEMTRGRARAIEDKAKQGWALVWLDRIEPGNAAARPDLVGATQAELSRTIGNEYIEQFLSAVKAEVGVTRNDAAIAALKRKLAGGGAR